jgi:predicted DCC family thiol-disulfide oxidoreductase YuxK
MIELGKYDYMLFDGDCGICTSFSEMAKRVDTQKRFVVEPYQKFSEEELRPFGTTHRKCAKKIHVIARSGHVYTGAFALNYFFIHYFPWSIPVVLVYTIPILLLIEIIGYAVVAKNRYHLSRWFGLKACVLNRSS